MDKLPGICAVHSHCGHCRDHEKGSSSRAVIALHLGWSVAEPWECPYGHPWGYIPLPVSQLHRHSSTSSVCQHRGSVLSWRERRADEPRRRCCGDIQRVVLAYECRNIERVVLLGSHVLADECCPRWCPWHPQAQELADKQPDLRSSGVVSHV